MPLQEAIQTLDVSDDYEDEGAAPGHKPEIRTSTPRDEKFAALIASRQADLEVQIGLPGSTNDLPALYAQGGELPTAAEEDVVQGTASQPAHAPEPAAAPSPIYERDGKQYMKLKVDGAEREVPLEKVVATMQKDVAADLRLQQASQRLRDVEAREQELLQMQHRIQQSPQLPQAGAPGADNEGLRTRLREALDGLYEGDTDAATEKLAELFAGRQAPTQQPVDLERAAAVAAERVIQQREYQRDLQQGQAQFVDAFPEIVSDPELFNMADNATIRISQEHPDWSPTRVLMEAGNRVNNWLNQQRGSAGQAPVAAAPAPANSREANKQGLKPMPAAQRNNAHVAPREPSLDHSPVGVIGRMRQGRGQH